MLCRKREGERRMEGEKEGVRGEREGEIKGKEQERRRE